VIDYDWKAGDVPPVIVKNKKAKRYQVKLSSILAFVI